MIRKSRCTAGGHLTDVPTYMTYSSVVVCDTVHIVFLIAALKNLDVLSGDIQNAFLEYPTKSKIFFYSGDECKADKDKVFYFFQSTLWSQIFISAVTEFLGGNLRQQSRLKSSLDEPDLWYKPMTGVDGFSYYAYILVDVEDLLLIMKDPKEAMAQIQDLQLNLPVLQNRRDKLELI